MAQCCASALNDLLLLLFEGGCYVQAGISQATEHLLHGESPALHCVSGLPTEDDLPTNVGARITRRRTNAGEPTVTKVARLAPITVSISFYTCRCQA